ncbi:MAG: DUF1587 domain-containing protein, partial [Planctomycetaceae bacterium]
MFHRRSGVQNGFQGRGAGKKMQVRPGLVLTGLLIFCQLSGTALSADDPVSEARTFLQTYCGRCHGEKIQKGDRRFDQLQFNTADPQALDSWQKILDVLHLGSMPPRRKNVTQPPAESVRRVVHWLETELRAACAQQKSTGGRTVYRRLNRFVYRNTIRDLLGINTAFVDPTEMFLPDEEEGGLDNIGSALVTSDDFLQHAMQAAERMIQRATHFEDRPQAVQLSLQAPVMTRKGGTLAQASRALNPYDEIFEQAGRESSAGYVAVSRLPAGVKASGRYRIRVRASASHQRHPWSADIPTDQD